MNYCPHCGVDLSGAAGARGPYEEVASAGLIVVGAATLIVGSLALLMLVLILTVDLPDGVCDICIVTFHNKTDTTLCYSAVGPQPGCAEIKPRDKTEFALDSCQGEPEVTVRARDGSEVYRRAAPCSEWDDAFILINRRDGQFVIADSIPARTEPPQPP